VAIAQNLHRRCWSGRKIRAALSPAGMTEFRGATAFWNSGIVEFSLP
jgi:hypothetical protein